MLFMETVPAQLQTGAYFYGDICNVCHAGGVPAESFHEPVCAADRGAALQK
jgi:cytochrome c5